MGNFAGFAASGDAIPFIISKTSITDLCVNTSVKKDLCTDTSVKKNLCTNTSTKSSLCVNKSVRRSR